MRVTSYPFWGADIDAAAHQQMADAMSLPVSVSGALMPDAHVGYGLPIGGVLATENAVIPYAVGVDIACRVMVSVVDFPQNRIESHRQRLIEAIEKETLFGTGKAFKKSPRRHGVLDNLMWQDTEFLKHLKSKAAEQLGTSGSGNHFVEFGTLELFEPLKGVEAGKYLALVSHSGSRGTGAEIANHYTRIARSRRSGEIPEALKNLSWLSLSEAEGEEYWRAMTLMGEYASANHHVIHKHVLGRLGARSLLEIENHHNYAWKEQHGGRQVVVHRKGATPAGLGVLGYIPGSMVAPGFLVRGRGNAESLHSAAHGAGRAMSRKAASRSITGSAMRKQVEDAGVFLLSAGLDEAPHAYKDIEQVMASQAPLIDVLGKFLPKIVKMAPAGERPED